MKLLGGILLAVVWYMMRKQAMLDKKYREENEKAGQAHGSEPVPRLVSVRIHYRCRCHVVDNYSIDPWKSIDVMNLLEYLR